MLHISDPSWNNSWGSAAQIVSCLNRTSEFRHFFQCWLAFKQHKSNQKTLQTSRFQTNFAVNLLIRTAVTVHTHWQWHTLSQSWPTLTRTCNNRYGIPFFSSPQLQTNISSLCSFTTGLCFVVITHCYFGSKKKITCCKEKSAKIILSNRKQPWPHSPNVITESSQSQFEYSVVKKSCWL